MLEPRTKTGPRTMSDPRTVFASAGGVIRLLQFELTLIPLHNKLPISTLNYQLKQSHIVCHCQTWSSFSAGEFRSLSLANDSDRVNQIACESSQRLGTYHWVS